MDPPASRTVGDGAPAAVRDDQADRAGTAGGVGAGRAGAGSVRAGRVRELAGGFGRAVVEVLPAWIAARIVVACSLVLAHLVVDTVRPDNAGAHLRVHEGLLGWDAGWYEAIAGHGYAASGRQSVRFYPGFPMAARVLGWIPGIGAGTALLVIANLCALAAMAGLLVLVRRDFGDRALARRSVWLLALAPAAYSLVLGYADAALILCAVATFLAARAGTVVVGGGGRSGRRPDPAGGHPAGGAGGHRGWRGRRRQARTAGPDAPAADRRGAGPAAGRRRRAAGRAGGLPGLGRLRSSAIPGSRSGSSSRTGIGGPITVPLGAMWHDLDSVVHGHHLGSALHIPWVLLSVALLVVAFRRLPLSYAAFATAVLAVSVTSSNLDSFERYALGAFPLVIAASTLTARRGVEWPS